MDVEPILKCRICKKNLQQPISCCGADLKHMFCEKCINRKNNKCTVCQNPVLSTNNVAMEGLLKIFKCKNKNCKFQLLSTDYQFLLTKKLDHERKCKMSDLGGYKCEFNKFCQLRIACTWIGRYDEIEQHFYSHTSQSAKNSNRVTIRINIRNKYLRLLKAQDQLFWYKHFVDIQKQKVYFIIQTVKHNARNKFEFKIKFTSLVNSNESLTLKENVSDDTTDANAYYLTENCLHAGFQDLRPFIEGEIVHIVIEVYEKQKLKLSSNLNQDGICLTTRTAVQNTPNISSNHSQQRKRGRSRNTRENKKENSTVNIKQEIKSDQNWTRSKECDAQDSSIHKQQEVLRNIKLWEERQHQTIAKQKIDLNRAKIFEKNFDKLHQINGKQCNKNVENQTKVSNRSMGLSKNLIQQTAGDRSENATAYIKIYPKLPGASLCRRMSGEQYHNKNAEKIYPKLPNVDNRSNRNNLKVDISHTPVTNNQNIKKDRIPCAPKEHNSNLTPNINLEVTEPIETTLFPASAPPPEACECDYFKYYQRQLNDGAFMSNDNARMYPPTYEEAIKYDPSYEEIIKHHTSNETEKRSRQDRNDRSKIFEYWFRTFRNFKRFYNNLRKE